MAWTEITRGHYRRDGQRYASDLTDAEWAVVEPLLPRRCRWGRPRVVDLRAVLDGLLYILATGCQWRALPRDFPPRSTVQGLLDRPWRERIERLAARLGDLLPADPAPALLHGDLWTGNILVRDGQLAALIDPACYHGHAEADLATLCLFAAPPDEFWAAYGAREEGWEERLPLYQLFPALVHLRLFGSAYAPLAERLLDQISG